MITTKEIHASIQSRLAGSAAFTTLVPAGQFGTWLKNDTIFPHVIFTYSDESLRVKQETTVLGTLVFDVWTTDESEAQAYDIRDVLVTLFDDQALSIASGDDPIPYFEDTDIALLDDGLTRNATIEFGLWFGS